MKPPDISLLGYALLGLLHQQPRSGYDLRKIFAMTPMQSFSDSPGAIYPALARLENKGLIRGQVKDGAGLRRKKVFALNVAGRAALKRWLRAPVRRAEVVRGWSNLMLRFAFTDEVLGETAATTFLRALVKELELYIPTLRQYFQEQRVHMPVSGWLALDSGIQGYEAQLNWARAALATYEKEPTRRRS